MLHIHYSNNLETLSQAHAQLLREPLSSVLAKEQVIVQNAGMAEWLSLQTASINGISANTNYLFPAEFMWQTLRDVLDDVPPKDPCAPPVMKWRLFAYFNQHDLPTLPEEVAAYLQYDQSEPAWQLANALADAFDQYLFFRPQWIHDWENGQIADWAGWQAELWQTLIGQTDLLHWVRLQNAFVSTLPSKVDQLSLPERVSFFSVPTLSQGYIRLLGEMAQYMDVHLYVLNPCQVYWGDIESAKRQSKMSEDEQYYTDTGNELLSSLGTQGRDYIDNLLELLPDQIHEHYHDIDVSSRLHAIQADILNLQTATQQYTDLPADFSLQIHACHSPMREVEVLHDQLLFALQNDATLHPDDIIIMMPNVEDYAPYIDAVFSHAPQALPFTIADLAPDQLSRQQTWLLQALTLPEQQFAVDKVMELLQQPDIQAAFGLSDEDLQQWHYWLAATNIRHSQGDTHQAHSWLQGLDRLLLGYALSDEQWFADTLPYPNIEGSQLDSYARFRQCVEQLLTIQQWQTEKQSLNDWINTYQQWLLGFFDNPALLKPLQSIQTDSEHVTSMADIPLSFDLFRRVLEHYQQSNRNDYFIRQGITFCTLVPMRSIPFAFVGLLGMNEANFPRKDNHNSFNLIAKHGSQKGDRSKRNEDRYLFLESLLAARQQCYLSYVGQSIYDNNQIPPSMVVGELIDYLQTKFGDSPEQLIVRHPLQAFSPHYFTGDERLFSYQQAYADQLNQQQKTDQYAPFLSKSLKADEDKKRLHLDELIQFYSNPSRYFVNHILHMKTQDYDIELQNREPFALESFVDRQIRDIVFQQLQQGISTPENALKTCQVKGLLPHGKPGEQLFQQQYQITEHFYANLPKLATESHSFDLTFDQFELYGKLDTISEQGLLHVQTGKVWIKQRIAIHLKHLVLNLMEIALPKKSHLYSPEESFVLPSKQQAHQTLQQLLKYYWQGLQTPLPFAPKSGWEYAQTQDMKKALTRWEGNNFVQGEQFTVENALLFAEQSPLDNEQFIHIAELLFKEALVE